MSELESVALLSKLTAPPLEADPQSLAAQHAAVLPRLREQVRRLPARRRRRRLWRNAVVAGGLVLSTSCVFMLLQWRATSLSPFVLQSGRLTSLESAGRGFVTGKEEASLLTRGGAHIAVAAGSRVQAVTSESRREQVVLDRGSVLIHVPHLEAGSAFSVKTPDALVTVHGTVFTVTVAEGKAGAQTCVGVQEGVVAVERAGRRDLLKRGEKSNCPGTAAAAPTLQDESHQADPAPPPASSDTATHQGLPVVTRPPAKSVPIDADASLGDQNRRLAAALQAERAGRFDVASQRLREFLARYPSSPLSSEATRSLERVERTRP